jgi:hypothetical protein
LRQNIVAIGDGLPTAKPEPRQRLANPDVQVRIGLILRGTVAVHRGERAPTNPVVPGDDLVPERGIFAVTDPPTELCIADFSMSRRAPTAASSGVSAPAYEYTAVTDILSLSSSRIAIRVPQLFIEPPS